MKPGLFGRVLVGVTVAIGFGAAWVFAASWVISLFEHRYQMYSRLVFQHDGTPLAMTTSTTDGTASVTTYTDSSGRPIKADDVENTGHEFLTTSALTPETDKPARRGWESRIRPFADGRENGATWYLVAEARPEGGSYLVGYDRLSNARVGFIGLNGLRPDLPPSSEFLPIGGDISQTNSRVVCGNRLYYSGLPSGPHAHFGRAEPGFVSGSDVYVLGRDMVVYRADLRERTLTRVANSVVAINSLVEPAKTARMRLGVRTSDAVEELTSEGKTVRRFPIPEPLREVPLTLALADLGTAVMYATSPTPRKPESRIYKVRGDGTSSVADNPLPPAPEPVSPGLIVGLVLPSPGALLATLPVLAMENRTGLPYDATPAERWSVAWAIAWPALLLSSVVAAVCAVAAYRRQIRYAAAGADLWVPPLLVLLFGLPAWVGYRFGNPWVVLERCPKCGREVPRDRDECAACHQQFAAPALKGTEVFA